MFLVPKRDGSLQVVQDFRELNTASHDDRYSMNALVILAEQGLPSSQHLDLTLCFWQRPLEEQSRHLTAFSISGLGPFEWV
jgi:hypothetical protein